MGFVQCVGRFSRTGLLSPELSNPERTKTVLNSRTSFHDIQRSVEKGCNLCGMEEVDNGGRTNTRGMLIQAGNGMRGSTFNDSSIFDHIIEVVFSVKQPEWSRDCWDWKFDIFTVGIMRTR